MLFGGMTILPGKVSKRTKNAGAFSVEKSSRSMRNVIVASDWSEYNASISVFALIESLGSRFNKLSAENSWEDGSN
jgi:hypothetical protein